MGLNYPDLDDTTRGLMTEEIRSAISDGSLYVSPRLTVDGRSAWPQILLKAAIFGSDVTLAAELRSKDYLLKIETRRKKNDFGLVPTAVPTTAADLLAEGEFNRYYVRAVSRLAIKTGVSVVVYRAKEVLNPRQSSVDKIGTVVDPTTLLESLKSSSLEVSLGLPPGPGSGLSVRLSK